METKLNHELALAIIEQSADALIFADAAGVIRIWNAAATGIFGFSADEAIGRSLDLIIPEHLRQAHWSGFRRAIESGVTRLGGRATITRAMHKAGNRLYVEMSFAIVRGSEGTIVGSVAIARDATARYEEERARRKPDRRE
jgi:PAS domain S-box-containing protein